MNILIYDIEIKKAILGKREQPIDGIDYCAGWHDHTGMGISCICAYDYVEQRYRVFLEDNLPEFQKLVGERETIVGFNSLAFDNKVCAANGITVPDEKSFDLLVALWAAAGLGPQFVFATHMGFGLDATCEANFGARKSGNGALAPVLYQRGQIGALVDYCLNDVILTRRLMDKVLAGEEPIVDPRDWTHSLPVRFAPPVAV